MHEKIKHGRRDYVSFIFIMDFINGGWSSLLAWLADLNDLVNHIGQMLFVFEKMPLLNNKLTEH